jgi:hypothetical protein
VDPVLVLNEWTVGYLTTLYQLLHNEKFYLARLGEKGNAYRILVRTPERKIPLGRP